MPTIPVYDAHEGIDPGQEPQVQLDNSVAAAEGRTGAAIEGIGNASTELFEHMQKREEQKQTFAASIGLQALTDKIGASDAAAANKMPADGNGWALARQNNAQSEYQGYIDSLPDNLKDSFGAKAKLLAQRAGYHYAGKKPLRISSITRRFSTSSRPGPTVNSIRTRRHKVSMPRGRRRSIRSRTCRSRRWRSSSGSTKPNRRPHARTILRSTTRTPGASSSNRMAWSGRTAP